MVRDRVRPTVRASKAMRDIVKALGWVSIRAVVSTSVRALMRDKIRVLGKESGL